MKNSVVVTSIIDLDDETYERLIEDVADHMQKSWIPIESDDDLPDEEGDYLVMVRKYNGELRQDVSSFFPMGVMTTDGKSTHWSIETGPLYSVLAWQILPPDYEEDEE